MAWKSHLPARLTGAAPLELGDGILAEQGLFRVAELVEILRVVTGGDGPRKVTS
jgi:hypothetical protein